MLGNKPPYTTMQQLNLDWVLSKLKTLLRLVPDDGAVGQILRRTRDGAVWSDEQGGGGGGAVQSVNGQTGAVVLDAADVGALPDDYTPPVTSVNGQTGAVTVSVPVQSVNGKTGAVVLGKSDVGLSNVDNVKQYSATNPPPYPVTSVNGQTGVVVLDADDVGALPDDYTPPVTSVNGHTGDVSTPFRFTRLWTNTAPLSPFAPQTISLELSGYDYVMVIANTVGKFSSPVICPIGKEGRFTYADGYQEYRPFTVTETGITFSDAVYVVQYGTSSSGVANQYLVPAFIFGIKE